MANEARFNDEILNAGLIEKQIKSAREQGADAIMVHAHWGWGERYPHRNIVAAAHRIAELGADVIVGTHPHVAQPMERYEYERDGERKVCLILYSLGDFVSFHPLTKDSKLTYAVRFSLAKGSVSGEKRTFVTGLRMLPVYIMAAEDEKGGYDFRLLKLSTVLKDGKMKEKLSRADRKDLLRLLRLLFQILLPRNYGKVLQMD